MTIQLGPDLNDEVEIARYMSFSAFMYMLEFRKAFVPSIANLRSAPGNHGDPTEGRWGPMDEFMRDGRAELLDLLVNGIFPSACSESSPKEPRPAPPTERTVLTAFGPRTIPLGSDHLRTLNNRESVWMDAWCWHKFDQEHMSMWRQYGAGDGAVCIRTTIGRLRAGMRLQEQERAYVGFMHYTDRFSGIPDTHAEFSLYLQKLHAYQYEQEIRVLVYDPASQIENERHPPGRYVALDIATLTQAVFVHPDSPEWMFEMIAHIVQAKIGRKVKRSDIYHARTFEV